MKIFALVSLLCAAYVIYNVWFKDTRSFGNRLLWTLAALLFSVITAVVYAIKK